MRRYRNSDSDLRRGEQSRGLLRAVGRVALWCVLAVVLLRGFAGIISGSAPVASGAPQHSAVGDQFPTADAGAFAVQFARAYFATGGGGSVIKPFLADDLSDDAAVLSRSGPGARVAWAMVARGIPLDS